jgi:mRNA interferase RelE/StbE
MYELEFHPLAQREWDSLEGSIQGELLAVLERRQLNPFVPSARLSFELAGCYKIKLQKRGIRLVYYPDGKRLIITVISVGRREDSTSYKAATNRFDD